MKIVMHKKDAIPNYFKNRQTAKYFIIFRKFDYLKANTFK